MKPVTRISTKRYIVSCARPFRLCRRIVAHMKPGSAVVNIELHLGHQSAASSSVHPPHVKAGLMGLTGAMAI